MGRSGMAGGAQGVISFTRSRAFLLFRPCSLLARSYPSRSTPISTRTLDSNYDHTPLFNLARRCWPGILHPLSSPRSRHSPYTHNTLASRPTAFLSGPFSPSRSPPPPRSVCVPFLVTTTTTLPLYTPSHSSPPLIDGCLVVHIPLVNDLHRFSLAHPLITHLPSFSPPRAPSSRPFACLSTPTSLCPVPSRFTPVSLVLHLSPIDHRAKAGRQGQFASSTLNPYSNLY